MPSHPCPQCPLKFGSAAMLATHIHHIHTLPQAAAATPQTKLGFLATVKASSELEAAAQEDERGHDTPVDVNYAANVLGGKAVRGPYPPTANPAIWSEGYGKRPPPEMEGMLGSFVVKMPGQPSTGSSGRTIQPSASGPTTGGVKTFTVVLEATNVRMQVPHNETFEAFQERMKEASVPIAEKFVEGREAGFEKKDGNWWYVLVDRKGKRDKNGERVLGGKLMYLAMVSELVKAWTGWGEVVVWHEKQKPKTDVEVRGETVTPAQSFDQQPAQRANLPILGPVPSMPARQPVSVLDSRTEYSTTRYLIQWMDGPNTWELESVLGDGNQWLIDAYQSEVDRGTH